MVKIIKFICVSILLHFLIFWGVQIKDVQNKSIELVSITPVNKGLVAKKIKKQLDSQISKTETQSDFAAYTEPEIEKAISAGVQTLIYPEYPLVSRFKKEEGIVKVFIQCQPDAVKINCQGQILKSSGYSRLDNAVLKSIANLNQNFPKEIEIEYEFKLR